MTIKSYFLLILIIVQNSTLLLGQQEKTVSELKITTLSTMVANGKGIGEWGYSALIEVDGKKILFDTGSRPETVLQNAQELGIDLSDVEDVFLSHNHWDHIGGLLTLRKELKKRNPNALSRIHVGEGIFSKRVNSENTILSIRDELEADQVEFIIYENQQELFPGVWITGPINRIHDERNWSGNGKIETENGIIEDTIPEDQSLVIDTKDGLVLVSGCGHAGLINTLEHVSANANEKKVFTIIGGFHLFNASDQQLEWTASKLKDFGVSKIIGAHCTGINSLYTLRELLELNRSDAIVGSVGDSFNLTTGIKAGPIAR
ncbi:MBL fold metallo-hydrolase [Algoriphagus sp. SE2]|uniref:MBL fold metallo-hydrolase n=1 Tax=Algoriphagus sp. SE2 TaxID=3141536 RepID=UPI0031CD412B